VIPVFRSEENDPKRHCPKKMEKRKKGIEIER
jgi:hypothetical protein